MLVADISYAQDPVVVEQMATGFDAVIVRWTDWKAWARGDGDDTFYNHHLRRFRELGKPTTAYLFPRPEMASAVEQVDMWASRTPESLDFSPMLDVELSGITGAQLQDWIEQALTRMKQVWGYTPLHYFSASLAQKHGTHRPESDHMLMVPGYPHRDVERTRYPAGQQAQWVNAAGGVGGVADYLPDGYQLDELALWQFTSTANVPGTDNSVDISYAYPAFINSFGSFEPAEVPTPPPPLHLPPPVMPPPVVQPPAVDLAALTQLLAPFIERGAAAEVIVEQGVIAAQILAMARTKFGT